MDRIKSLIKDGPIHQRTIEVRTYPVEGDRVVAEGWLRDERLIPGYYWDGRIRPPHRPHHMCVRLLIGGWPLTVLDAEAEMPTTPFEGCRTTSESLQKIVGLPLVSGFSDRVRERLGGVEGCTHLTALIVSMGPPALHGFWTMKAREKQEPPRSFDEVPGLAYTMNSCTLWAEDGPIIQMIKDHFKAV
ncbi:MAG: DUF2889 domain-containing protein [Proteobacteria bacterium]|nr:DUF2889 domain-containing protein [Pseudomonadota bacterium]